MNSSAKMTVVSFLAATALGAAVFTGCTATSGTVDDTDGGTQTPAKDSGTSETSTPTDDGGTPAVCESKQEGDFIDAKCQACLAGSCCTELKGCFDIAGDTDAGKVDCNTYSTCIDDCGTKPDAERQACYDDCDLTAADGVATAYTAIETCATTNCAADCAGQ